MNIFLFLSIKATCLKRFIIIFLLTLKVFSAIGDERQTFWFDSLNRTIRDKHLFEQEKLDQIRALAGQLSALKDQGLPEKYEAFQQLHLAYFNFDDDSAMAYALKMLETAGQLNEALYISEAKLSLGTTLLASGIFNEAKDTLSSIDTAVFPDSLKIEYYYVFSRLYFDMVDYYQRSFFIDPYVQSGLLYLDSALALTSMDTGQYFSLMGLKLVRTFDYPKAASVYERLFMDYNPKGRQFAIDASTYGFVLEQNGRPDEGMVWLIRAAIEDIRLANKENVALINLANRLFQQGKIEQASAYLDVALEDASTFGALQRKFQISQIQPIVEAARLKINEEQKDRIKRYAIVVTLLSLLIVVILGLLFLNLQKVKAVQKEIRKTNLSLQQVNQKLREVNLIKNEYIGHFFKTNSDLIDKLEDFRQRIENKVNSRKIDDLLHLISKQNIKEEREEMYRTFDTVFLTIFPDFVNKFNALFPADDRFEINSTGQLNTDLRIFALIRLGISDTEKIAHILNYSVHTINTYKTKIKNRSVVSNDDFEKEIMKIQSI